MVVKFGIYQLPKEHDLVWRDYADWAKVGKDIWATVGKDTFLDGYVKVYSGEKYVNVYGDSNTLTALTSDILERIFEDFNTDRPNDYTGRLLSVSDVVSLTINGEIRYYYCDSIGWVRI